MARTLALVRAPIFVAGALLAAAALLALAPPADATDAGGAAGAAYFVDGESYSADGDGTPTFGYETVVPGYYLSRGTGVTVDGDGNAYVIGSAYADRVRLDVLVIKVGPDGSVLWTTYIEGSGHDYAEDIILDDSGDVLVTGWTDSDDFPTTPDALDGTLTGFRDAFLTKLSSASGAILYSTFLGGDYVDEAHGITLNGAGEIYLVGSTESTDFPTVDAYQDEPSAPLYIFSDAFITRLTAAGDEILYSTYFGGFENDAAESVALDEAGNIIIAGETDSDDFPLADPIQSQPDDIFVSRLSADGSAVQFSTYFGGEDLDRLGGAALDSEGFVYLAGSTRSVDFPTTAGAYQEDFVGEILGCEVPFGADFNCDDVFVTKLGTDGSGLVYSTFLGGSEIEEARDVAVDGQGRAHVVGFTNSPDFPPSGIDFGAEIFVSRFDPSGGDLEYSITRDSGSANAGHGVAVDDAHDVYFTGAVNVPADIYVARITEVEIPDVSVSISSPMTHVPRNSVFSFNIQITNNEAAPQTFKLWTAAQKLPAGAIHQPLQGPAEITLDPGETKTFLNLRHWVGRAPLATYRFYARIGEDFPGPLWDQSYLDLEVTR